MSVEVNETRKNLFIDIMDNAEYDALPEEWPMNKHMMAGAIAGILEHATMYPIDSVKVCSLFLRY